MFRFRVFDPRLRFPVTVKGMASKPFCSVPLRSERDYKGHLFHQPQQNKVRWENVGVKKQNLYSRCLTWVCRRKPKPGSYRFLLFDDPSSKKVMASLLNMHSTEFILNTLTLPPSLKRLYHA